jgi:hypothetical protein
VFSGGKPSKLSFTPVKVEPNMVNNCAACGHHTVSVVRHVAAGIEMLLCADGAECSRRFRTVHIEDVTVTLDWPAFMAALRAETRAHV